MTATNLISLFDQYALRLFNILVLAGLSAVAVGAVAQ
jgi:hypothetical protein